MANIVVIDPGHGGRDSGAVGPKGLQEKAVTLAVAKLVAEVLQGAGIDARLTRESDIALGSTTSADLSARVKAANQAGAEIFVSIHCNSATNNTAGGTETYHYPGSTLGNTLAKAVHTCVIPALGRANRGIKTANFAVLRETDMPACLVEMAFISNPAEEALLGSAAFQETAATAIAQGIANYLGVELLEPVEPGTVRIIVDGQVLTGLLIDDRSYAPVRALAEALGRTVEWDEKTKTVKII
ncbi:N-acetylmuramoyl-L-alanine amidase [Desulforamulus ruminis]|uniref:N-acetylmuramoyl-L-alanine amidase n=1 Tax=Desulforamulus ruminis (strain ATCC 23193 / DSM 2154 / NCIMB 8452 / DL) TaxID=696281 RepID=F6DS96_DESRL|nr:N-acetylmuramoyl-L-alanine amidase [Desulforamulus ruminis]AEG59875.1 N-acetylmuramoyl-L-alanine amidase [Desulforamulus ruminis DSM 2154]